MLLGKTYFCKFFFGFLPSNPYGIVNRVLQSASAFSSTPHFPMPWPYPILLLPGPLLLAHDVSFGVCLFLFFHHTLHPIPYSLTDSHPSLSIFPATPAVSYRVHHPLISSPLPSLSFSHWPFPVLSVLSP